ncbi:hypothetical protein [Bradyrhizobium sp.]|uniref:hypothetical protein n=1 Tax=Bradyrhizobium sp. TaxID=376 RepID=UPI00262E71A6|nr:hypothetical protein [Bradyrhizobium sp.]
MNGRTLNGRTLALVALFGIVAGTAMSDPAAQPGQSQPASQSADTKKQSELTPSQLIAQDFRTMAQEHATVGAANPGKEQEGKR